jgi:hypothetical protein
LSERLVPGRIVVPVVPDQRHPVAEEVAMPGRPTLALLLAAPLLAASACTTPVASAAPQPPPATAAPVVEPSYWPGQDTLMDAGTTIDATAPTRWPAAYAGVELDLPAGHVLVHRVPTPGMDDAIRALVPQVSVRFVDTAYSERQIAGWMDQVLADWTYWQRRGVTVHEVWPRFGTCVVVGVEDPRRHASVVAARYPSATVCVEHGSPAVPLVQE